MAPAIFRFILRLSVVMIALLGLYRLSHDAATLGASRLCSMMSIITSSVDPADSAVRWAPSDPEAHYTRGLALVNAQRLDSAVVELREATQLRPHHYYEWLDLGVTLDRLGDEVGSEDALRQAISLAPSFSQPHWQLGNLLFRQGKYEDAFAEMRRATATNPDLFENMASLAWVAAANADAAKLKHFVDLDTRESHFWIARFLARRGKGADAARELAAAGEPSEEWERAFVRESIAQLISADQFNDAYAAWTVSHPDLGKTAARGQLVDGTFSQPILQDEPGFGWQIARIPNLTTAIDPAGPTPGSRSIRLQFGGDSSTDTQILRQLVLVEPGARYTLTFVIRAEELISGGPPIINVFNASAKNPRVLGQSEALPMGSAPWSPFKIEFATDDAASAIVIILQRRPCPQSPCPVFGKLWLANFSLSRIKP
jgi:tetratricopeptide (TPR) repeat protein